jgi:hypothetical protein
VRSPNASSAPNSGRGLTRRLVEDEQLGDASIDSKAEISLHALSGACTAETMRLPVAVQEQSLIALVDSGSTHCFMAAHVAHRLNLSPMAKDGMTMGVANGERLPCLRVCSVLPLTINGELFCIDFLVIALEGYEMVLGCNWLRTLGLGLLAPLHGVLVA